MNILTKIYTVFFFAIFTFLASCTSDNDNDNQLPTSTYVDLIVTEARAFRVGDTYKAFESVQFSVQNAAGRDVSVRFTNSSGSSIEQRAVLIDDANTYIVLINPATAEGDSSWTVEFIVGQSARRFGDILIRGLPVNDGSLQPGEVTLRILEGFLNSLQRDIQQLESSLNRNNISSMNANEILAKSQQLFTSQQQEVQKFRELVITGTPIVNSAGQTVFDKDFLEQIDRTYLGMLEQFTTASFDSSEKSDSRARTISVLDGQDFSGFADELIAGFKKSVFEGVERAGQVGEAFILGGTVVALAATATVSVPLAIAGAMSFVVTTFLPTTLNALVSGASDQIQGREFSTEAHIENATFIAEQTCSFGVDNAISVPIGGFVCDAVKGVADLTIDIVDSIGELANDPGEMLTNDEDIPSENVEIPSESNQIEDNSGCTDSFGPTLCERHNFDINVLTSRARACCQEARDWALEILNETSTSTSVPYSPSCEMDVNSFLNDFGGQSAVASHFNIDIPEFNFNADPSDLDSLEAEFERWRQDLMNNLPSCQ